MTRLPSVPHVMSTLAFAAALLILRGSATAGEPHVAPVERNGFRVLTGYEELRSFVLSLTSAPGIHVESIARTREGRDVFAVGVRAPLDKNLPAPRLRVLLFAQQHGDEPSGKEALTLLLADFAAGRHRDLLERMELTVVPQMNPDGSEAGERRTSDGIDLNRDHLLLTSPEVSGLHALFGRLRPDVTLDIHEYASFSRSWTDSGLAKTGDVQVGTLTNLNCGAAVRAFQRDRVLPFVASAMGSEGYSCHEYIVGSPAGRIRNSTTEINDGRQSMGIQGALSFIQEGRQGKGPADEIERRARSQEAAVVALLRFCASHADEVARLVAEERVRLAGSDRSPFVTVMEHVPSGARIAIPVLDLRTGEPGIREVSTYHGAVQPLDTVMLPAAYLISGDTTGVADLLARHGLVILPAGSEPVEAESFVLEGLDTLELEEQPHIIPRLRVQSTVVRPAPGAVIVPLDQTGSLLAATLLEPRSMWGISRYARFRPLLLSGAPPIFRMRSTPASVHR